MKKFLKKANPSLIIGAAIILLVAVTAIVAFFWTPYAPNVMDNAHSYLKPGDDPAHLLGTDQFGRDILSRIMEGSKTVLIIGFISVICGAFAGTLLGSIAGVVKGPIGSIIMRAMEGFIAFPSALLAIMLVAVVGKGETGAIIAISIYTIAPFARLTNTMILENENLPAIKAAKSFGVDSRRLLTHYYLPMMLPRLLTQFSASVGSAIMTEAALSFLGLGVQPPNASWGLMLSNAKQYALLYPYLAFAPGIAIIVTVLGFHLLSDGLGDLLIKRRS